MLYQRKTVLSMMIAMSLGGFAAADEVGVQAQAEAGLRSQIAMESRGMVGTREGIRARGAGYGELATSVQADADAAVSAGSTQIDGSVRGDADAQLSGERSAEAEAEGVRTVHRGMRTAATVGAEARQTVHEALDIEIDAALRGHIGADIAGAVDADVGVAIAQAVDAEVIGEIQGQVADAIEAEVISEVATAVTAEVEQTLASELDAAIEQELQTAVIGGL